MGIYGSIVVSYITEKPIRPVMENTSHLVPTLTETTPQVSPHFVAVKDGSTGQQTNNCYVYLHLRESDGSVFYVGKGTLNRAWDRRKRTLWWRNIVAKHGLSVAIVKNEMPEACAFSLEKALIRAYSGQLCNLTDGGEGSSGYRHTEENLAIMRAMKIGYKPKVPRESIIAAAKRRRGSKMSEESRAKMRAAAKGRVITNEWRANMSKAQKGRKHSPEHVKNQADAQRGKKLSEEQKARIGDFHRGKKLSESHIAAISKPVICSNGMEFISSAAAARWVRENTDFTKASGTNIRYCVTGVTSHAYGFTWRYAP